MSFITDFQFAFQKNESVTLLALVILSYLLIMHSGLTYRHIVYIIPVAGIAYFYYTYTVDRSYTSMHTQNDKIAKIDIDSFPYIQEDIETIDILLQLEPLYTVNRLQYMEIFTRLNRFFMLYQEVKSGSASRLSDKYRLAKDECNMVLNALGTFAVRLDTDDERRALYETGERLKVRCQLYLNEMETRIQREWKDGEITVHSQPIYPDDPMPSVFGDIQYSKHYNLY
jgi:hypothetical protein